MPPVTRTRSRRNTLDFHGSQLGDLSQRDIAGGNIYNGVSPKHIIALLHEVIGDSRQFRKLDQLEREQRRADADEKSDALRDEVGELKKQVDHIAKDIGQYREIGVSADAKTVGALRESIATAERRIGTLRIALIVAAVVIGLMLVALAWLLYRDAVSAALRPILGGLAALALAARKP
jgi:hypothetical protein